MQKLIILAGLEAYAVLLAWLQGGVRTDEAKYLLNIPYPHPPLARWFLSLFDGFDWQAGAARVLFASLVVQAVWIVWSMGRGMPRLNRLAACAGWLFSWGVVSQAGAVMMAPLTALQGLVFLWLFLRDDDHSPSAGLIALSWLASLFTAYQIALFSPLVFAIFWRMKLPTWKRLAFIGVPVFLLCVYTLTNPFALASMLNQAGKDGALPLAGRALAFTWLWFASGSAVLSVAGTGGLFLSRRWPLIATFLLVCGYVLAGFHDYYGILLVPLFIAGFVFLSKGYPRWGGAYAVLFAAGACVFAALSVRLPRPSVAHETMYWIAQRGPQGTVLIDGSFGHEWQYESPYPVLKYGEWLLPDAQTVVCLRPECPVRDAEGFSLFMHKPEVWIRGDADIGGI